MIPYLDRFERIVMHVLLAVLAAVVLLATVELVWVIAKDVLTPPVFVLEIHELLDLFGLFLLVLIGIELMHSVKTYLTSRVYHLETVLSVALIAVARKVIVLEPKELPEGALLGIAVLVLALALGYTLLRRSHQDDGPAAPERRA